MALGDQTWASPPGGSSNPSARGAASASETRWRRTTARTDDEPGASTRASACECPNPAVRPQSNTPPPGGVRRLTTSPARRPLVPTPLPLPSAFSQTNVYTFGQAPQNNYAAPNGAPQIFYVQVSPSVVKNGQMMSISAITTTNVAQLTFGPNALLPMATLQSIGQGQWQGTFPFSAAGLPIGQASVTLNPYCYYRPGLAVALPVPLSLLGP